MRYKKNVLLKCGEEKIRVLDSMDNQVLIIDCARKTMPKWVSESDLEAYTEYKEEYTYIPVEDMKTTDKRVMYERYNVIVSILPFVSDCDMRSVLIDEAAKEMGVSKTTVRNWLCLYLSAMDIRSLAPCNEKKQKQLSQDEKNMRWALNKFYYTQKKYSLTLAYKMMLKEKYTDGLGCLRDKYPSYHQFRYFYRKTKNYQNFYISRFGIKEYQKNYRPLVGDVTVFASAPGVGLLDATVCDIYLVDDGGKLIGRPILTACVDAYSGMCLGYSLTWEGGMYSLRDMLLNVINDKTDYCKKFGIDISEAGWCSGVLPGKIITDKGAEYKSQNFEQLSELGVHITNLPSFRPELKGAVEKFFDCVQGYYKPHLKGKGVIEMDYQQRGVRDYRKDACLTIREFETIILHCILYYNNERVMDYPFTEDMIEKEIKPYASSVWEYGLKQDSVNLISVSREQLIYTLLPRTNGVFSRNGLKVNGIRYHNNNFMEKYLEGGRCEVAYNPDDMDCVWLIENGIYIRFEMIESRYKEKSASQIEQIRSKQKEIIKAEEKNKTQAEINLINHILTVADKCNTKEDTSIKNIRINRQREKTSRHKNFVREVAANV